MYLLVWPSPLPWPCFVACRPSRCLRPKDLSQGTAGPWLLMRYRSAAKGDMRRLYASWLHHCGFFGYCLCASNCRFAFWFSNYPCAIWFLHCLAPKAFLRWFSPTLSHVFCLRLGCLRRAAVWGSCCDCGVLPPRGHLLKHLFLCCVLVRAEEFE